MMGDVTGVYRRAWTAARLFPLLFLIPALAEFAQHVAEMQAGMYDSMSAAKAVADGPARMAFGFVKTIAILVPTYWFVRYLAFGDVARAKRPEQPAFGLWLGLMALQVAILAWSLFGPSLSAGLGLAGKQAGMFDGILAAASQIVSVYLLAWLVAWPLGNRAMGPVRSARAMAGSFWRSIGYMLACILPLMIAHYALGYLAIIVLPEWLDWPALAIDSLVVSLLACCMAGAGYAAAAHAARRKHASLLPLAA